MDRWKAVIVAEGLFGRVNLPEWARGILLAPEVQRLREVRLINTSSPYLSALSDAKRFTHTLGVTHLANAAVPRLRHVATRTEIRSFVAAAIVHDVGSPPFGHLFEYLLKSRTGWTHEAALSGILSGDYRPDNIYHQIYYGKALSLGRAFERAQVDPDLVAEMVLGRGKLGPLLAGTIDFDNLDNVFRMTSLLGLDPDVDAARRLADALLIDDGRLVIDYQGLESLHTWRSLRRRAYEILAFDQHALAGQAMLTDSITEAMAIGTVSSEQWFWTDEELLRQLCSPQQPKAVRAAAQRFVVGDFYECLGVFWYEGADDSKGDLRLDEYRNPLTEQLSTAVGFQCSIYAFYDRGTFEKRLSIRVRECSNSIFEDRTIGSTSQSAIIGVFSPRRRIGNAARYGAMIVEVLEGMGLRARTLQQIPAIGEEFSGVDSQAQLPL